jgi:hypothetical protein
MIISGNAKKLPKCDNNIEEVQKIKITNDYSITLYKLKKFDLEESRIFSKGVDTND